VALINDYWKNASLGDWQDHVIQHLELSRAVLGDGDHTYFEATRVFSKAYCALHEGRMVEQPAPRSERELEEQFWHLQCSSMVIDAIVGGACVVLMRWIDQARQVAITAFDLLETKFPFETMRESEAARWHRHNGSVMQDYGSRVQGKMVSGALAIWQIGNVFKHGGGTELHGATARVVTELGFSSPLLAIPAHEEEEGLRRMALQEVSYTLGADSIERMALQLGCGPSPGLMPLYDHVESWHRAIDTKLLDEQASLRGPR